MKSTINISRRALQANFRAVQAAAGAGVEVLAVVKANAYGHGATLCAPVLVAASAKWLGVSDVGEGMEVRAAVGDKASILVMCGMEAEDALAIIAHQLTPVVWTAAQIKALEGAASFADTICNVHLEVDTGMSRQGCLPGDELAATLTQLARSSHVVCEGVMSHLCCAESAGSVITHEQQLRFERAIEQVHAAGMKPKYLHLGNSSAVDEGSTARFLNELARQHGAMPMVRTGIALYGHLLPLEGEDAPPAALAPRVTPVMTWTTRVLDVRAVPAGTTVGYGATYEAAHDMRLALLPVGYADGFRRAASSGIGDGWVMIAGRRAPVVGRVSMNLTVVDVTDTAEIGVGNEVTLMGEGVSAEDHARWSGTIAYDILCGVRGLRGLQA